MGKSPGKWIKTVLFGKKSPRSNISKGRENLVNKREEVAASNASNNGLALDLTPIKISRDKEDLELEDEESENLSPRNQEINIEASVIQDAQPDPEKIMQEEAAIKAQAAFRGYMARRAFGALKGIIKLQALIRGHLVRRQAVATLCGMYGIVKLQALVRGGSVRRTNAVFGLQEHYNLFKPLEGKLGERVGISKKLSRLSANTFIYKLLASSITVAPLHMQYVVGDPNSVLSWLERWSASYFWKPVPQPKKTRDNISLKKKCMISIGEAQISKSKRTNRKLPSANFESVQVQTNPKLEKPKQNFRKISGQLSDPEQENPQSELEKVKRNLRKIHNPVVENTIVSEVEGETTKQHLEKTTEDRSSIDHLTSNEKIKKAAALTISNALDVEIIPRPSNNEVPEIPCSFQVTVESMPLIETITKDRNTSANEDKTELINLSETTFKDENSQLTNRDSIYNEDLTGRKNQKSTRKASILAKREYAENGLQNSQTLPSYMAATESAKAKLRIQGSPKFEQDESERNNTSGRHSLPSSTNSKVDSHTPRTRRSVQSGGKGGPRSDKTIQSSRGTNGKVIQAEWRR